MEELLNQQLKDIKDSIQNVRDDVKGVKTSLDEFKKEMKGDIDFLKEKYYRHDENIEDYKNYKRDHEKKHDELTKEQKQFARFMWMLVGIGVILQIVVPILINYIIK